MKKHFPYILTEESYQTSRFTEFTSARSVKDMDSTTTQRRLYCSAYFMKRVSNTAKKYEKHEKPQEGFGSFFLCPIYQQYLCHT